MLVLVVNEANRCKFYGLEAYGSTRHFNFLITALQAILTKYNLYRICCIIRFW